MADPLDAFARNLRGALDPTLRSLFSEEFVVCSELFERFTTETAAADLERLGLAEAFGEPSTPEEVLARRGYAPRAAVALAWMLEKLAAEGYFEKTADSGPARYRRRAPFPPEPGAAKERALAIDPGCAPAFAVVEALSGDIREYFEGRKTGEEILFAPSRLSLWFDYFNNANLLYAVNNLLGAEVASRVLPASGGAVVLELGGGAGSAALALLARLSALGTEGRVGRYLFTEPVAAFRRRGERFLRERFPRAPIAASRLDMDAPFEEQGVEAGSVDLVYAVNTVHVARDLGATLERIRGALRPGGRAVFSECVRPVAGQPIYVEYIFNFLRNFVEVVTDPETRPTHGFLTPANWRAALTRAGFDAVEIVPDVEALARDFPSFFVGAIVARKPASRKAGRGGAPKP
jgi:SAM-dependent methyltransferase